MANCTALLLVGSGLEPGQRAFCLGRALVLTGCKLAPFQSARANYLPSPASAVASLIGWPYSLLSGLNYGLRWDTSNEVQGRFKEAGVAQSVPLLIGLEACFLAFNNQRARRRESSPTVSGGLDFVSVFSSAPSLCGGGVVTRLGPCY